MVSSTALLSWLVVPSTSDTSISARQRLRTLQVTHGWCSAQAQYLFSWLAATMVSSTALLSWLVVPSTCATSISARQRLRTNRQYISTRAWTRVISPKHNSSAATEKNNTSTWTHNMNTGNYLAVLWIRNYFFRIRIRIRIPFSSEFWIRIRILYDQ
jgi:hypothetical protein